MTSRVLLTEKLLMTDSNQPKKYFCHQSSFIDDDCIIGDGTKIWHFSHIMSKSKIGSNCNIGQNVVISPNVIIGNNVKIQNNVSVYTGVVCEDDVFLGPSMVFTNVINPRSQIVRKGSYESTLVKRGASIGANATIICGTTIGIFALVGAGSVITKNVKNYALVVGNPGKQIGWISEYGNNLKFNNEGTALCTETKEKSILKNNEVIKLT